MIDDQMQQTLRPVEPFDLGKLTAALIEINRCFAFESPVPPVVVETRAMVLELIQLYCRELAAHPWSFQMEPPNPPPSGTRSTGGREE
jgi:hypothetical protein